MFLLNLDGPTFLLLYVTLLASSCGILLFFRHRLRGPGGSPPDALELSPLEVAYLQSELAASAAALGSLVHRNVCRLDAESQMLVETGERPRGLHPLEAALAVMLPTSARALQREGCKKAHLLRPRLEELGLLVSAARAFRMRVLSTCLLGALGLLGSAKVVLGLQRGRPVLFLVLLVCLTLGIAVLFARKRARRTRRGDLLMRKLKEQHQALRYNRANEQLADLSPGELALGVALFGPIMLQGGLQSTLFPRAIAESWDSPTLVHSASPPPSGSSFSASYSSRDSGGGCSSGDSGSSSSSGDSGSSCSSGDSGGGGGCGGCGGGGD